MGLFGESWRQHAVSDSKAHRPSQRCRVRRSQRAAMGSRDRGACVAKLLTKVLRCAMVAASIAASGCVGAGDIVSGPMKELVAGYCLELDKESGDYRLRKCWVDVGDDQGIFDGTLDRIGWNGRYIAGWRTPVSSADRAGWMILDISDGRIEGPYSQSAFDSLRSDRPALRGIVTSPCRDVLR